MKTILNAMKYLCLLILCICCINGITIQAQNEENDTSSAIPAETEEVYTGSGWCGEDMYWELTEDGTLTISGTGKMDDYHYNNPSSPWYNKRWGIKKVVIEKGVERIGSFAFYLCEYMTQITLPEGLVEIGDGAFWTCTSLKSVKTPSSLREIEIHAFSDCRSLRTVTLSEGITEMGSAVFEGCKALESIRIPKTLTTLNSSMFTNCTSLHTVILPDTLQYIYGGAFWGCQSLSSINIPKSVTSIGGSAFQNCISLQTIVIPDGVELLESGVFGYCTNLTTVTLPKNLKTIQSAAFIGDENLHLVIYPSCIEDWKNVSVRDRNSGYYYVEDGYGRTLSVYYGITDPCIRYSGLKPEDMKWNDSYTKASIDFVCDTHGTVEKTVTARITKDNIDASCEREGKTVYTGTANFNGTVYESKKTKTIPALGHDYKLSAWNWKKDLSSAKASFVCRRDDTHTAAADAVITSRNVAETSSDPAHTEYTASVTMNGKTYTDVRSKYGPVDMYRIYNPNSGEHFYTSDQKEKDALVNKHGWTYEGVGWVSPERSSIPVYRLYNKKGGEHHYTTDKKERDALINKYGWTDEKIGWYSDEAETIPVYREYNPNAFANNHNYTPDTKEHSALLNKYHWKDEGIAWYAIGGKKDAPKPTPKPDPYAGLESFKFKNATIYLPNDQIYVRTYDSDFEYALESDGLNLYVDTETIQELRENGVNARTVKEMIALSKRTDEENYSVKRINDNFYIEKYSSRISGYYEYYTIGFYKVGDTFWYINLVCWESDKLKYQKQMEELLKLVKFS